MVVEVVVVLLRPFPLEIRFLHAALNLCTLR